MAKAPSRKLTFLFTDLESSTRRWEDYPDLMSSALARHDELVHEFIGAHGGTVFSGMGDGVAAAFERATDAASAAIAIQGAIAEERWSDSLGPLRVRIGMHSGEAEVRDASYYGSAVNRAARVMALAWGGQVVCTSATASVLAEGIELRDLGEHRLRDLSRPEHLWQVDVSMSFPPLLSGSNLPGNLPTQVTEFVGRQGELRRVRETVDSSRIVTLTGVGGAGKTRLALQFAAEAQPSFRNGAWLCDLASLTSPDGVVPLVAIVVGVELAGDDREASVLADSLKRRQLLLVLDNCEHVLDAAAALTDELMHRCPEVVVLATSREGLGVLGERIIPIGSLAFPDADDRPDVARATDAVRLFLARANDVRALPADDDEAIVAIAQVCRRLDGIPLAIELAAARTQSLSVTEIARHLDDRFKLLTRGARTALGRHQTLRAAIDWSFDLLTDAERRILLRASIFAGGFTLDAAVAVCDPATTSAVDTLDHVDGLVRRSMLVAEEDHTTTRYRMLETIRQYAAEHLEVVGEATDTSRLHADWCRTFAVEAGEGLRGRDDASWIARMERELDNIRIALSFSISVGDFDCAQTLLASAPIGALWDNRLGASMAAVAKETAPILGEPEHPVSAALLSLLALDAALRFAGDEAADLAERACAVARRHNDWLRTGPWLAWLLASLIAHRSDAVMLAASEAFEHATADDDMFAIAEWHAELGIAHWMAGNVERAQQLTETGLVLAEQIGAKNLISRNAFLRGASLLIPGADPALALPYFQMAVQLGERVGGNVLYGGAAWATLLSDRGKDNMTAAALAHELAANLPTPMFLIDADGMMIFYNDATASILGKPFEDVGKINSAEFGAQLDLATSDGQYLRRLDSPAGIAWYQHRPAHQKVLATGYDGRRSAYAASAYPLFGSKGEMQGVVAVFWEHTNAGDSNR